MKAEVVLFAVLTVAHAAVFPPSYKQCQQNDEACMKQVITSTFKSFFTGIEGIGLSSLDPVRIAKMDIVQGDGPINIVMNFKNVDLVGLKSMTVQKASGFTATPNKMELNTYVPVASIVGPYKINGKVLVLPIQGTGFSNMTMANLNVQIKWNGKMVEREGKQYYQMDKFKANFDTSRFYMDLSNLFNGDKVLGDNMNVFLNENWQDILRELKPNIVSALTKVFKPLISKVFDTVPYNELYLQ